MGSKWQYYDFAISSEAEKYKLPAKVGEGSYG
jgi:hypothetical protein